MAKVIFNGKLIDENDPCLKGKRVINKDNYEEHNINMGNKTWNRVMNTQKAEFKIGANKVLSKPLSGLWEDNNYIGNPHY